MTTATDTAAVRAAFLADIIEHPEDDVVRLIFADWLEDNGEEERAELIRVQVGLKTAECLHSKRRPCPWCTLRHRGEELIRRYPERATGLPLALVDLPAESVMRRGFLHRTRLPTALWLQHRVELVRNHPMERVELTDKKPVQGVTDDPDPAFHEKWYWSVYNGRVLKHSNSSGHILSYDIVGDLKEIKLHGMWSIHDTEPLALDWLSEKLLARAKELAKEAGL